MRKPGPLYAAAAWLDLARLALDAADIAIAADRTEAAHRYRAAVEALRADTAERHRWMRLARVIRARLAQDRAESSKPEHDPDQGV